ncbi:drug:proton antiporter [Thalassospira profundimaris]|uniref:Drug:proton antiporter n=1 Tax=Thalassospira profundimaris TaxID=502049 RepID=A0A367WMD2_9PROT|nr:VOC family protein [Thalassospira profundimaris]RCK42567.1 drug:proton antiporter [Thalassospira profundimaris]
MLQPSYVLLYVASAPRSAAFYQDILDCEPVESAATFALFVTEKGHRFGLWGRDGVEPAVAPDVQAGCGEVGFPVESRAVVDGLYARWREKGLVILQSPTEMDFGYTFVAADPDGHRLRIFSPAI